MTETEIPEVAPEGFEDACNELHDALVDVVSEKLNEFVKEGREGVYPSFVGLVVVGQIFMSMVKAHLECDIMTSPKHLTFPEIVGGVMSSLAQSGCMDSFELVESEEIRKEMKSKMH